MPFQTEPRVWLLQEPKTSLVFSLYAAFLYQWVMNLFFFLAGAGGRFALQTRSNSQFISERIKRLLVPLIAVSLTLVPLQVYLSLKFMGQFQGTFVEFIRGWVPYCSDSRTALLVDYGCYTGHLWFLGFLFAYALFTLPLARWILSPAGLKISNWVSKAGERPLGIFWFVLPVAIIQVTLHARFPQHQNFSDFCQWLVYFLYGFIFIADDKLMEIVERNRRVFLMTGVISFMAILLLLGPAGFVNAWERHPAFSPGFALYQLLRSLNTWAWVLFAIGMGRRYLNFHNRRLQYSSEAVLPFYILHHPIIIMFTVVLAAWHPIVLEKFLVLGAASFLVTLGIYELIIRRNSPFTMAFRDADLSLGKPLSKKG